MSVYPSYERREMLRAVLAGYCEQLHAVALDKAVEIVRRHAPAGVAIDGMIVSRLLRSLKFNRSHLPADAGSIIYRRTAA